jgi:tRNA-Thr(GGU) m(6)t(6)A37 methyltransferase TsaA
MEIRLTPIAFVRNTRTTPTDDFWGGTISEIELAPEMPVEVLDSIGLFSHLEIIYHFNQTGEEKIVYARRPRGNPAYPLMGIFAQRNKDRPNGIGLTTVELIEQTGRILRVRYLDAIDGTPVLDIKPVFREFMPKGEIRQPDWVDDLMKEYWRIDETLQG